MRLFFKSILFSILTLIWVSCGKDMHTPFKGDPKAIPATLQNPTEFCYKNSSGSYVNQGPLSKGKKGSHFWARGGGCILRPIEDVFQALQSPHTLKWNDTTSMRLERQTPPRGVDVFIKTFYTVKKVFITVHWTIEWYFSSKNDPNRQITVNYQKTEGTSFIPYWKGTIRLDQVEPQVTSFGMWNEIEAQRQNADDTLGAILEIFGKVKTLLQGGKQQPSTFKLFKESL